jgi:hypothetical protein
LAPGDFLCSRCVAFCCHACPERVEYLQPGALFMPGIRRSVSLDNLTSSAATYLPVVDSGGQGAARAGVSPPSFRGAHHNIPLASLASQSTVRENLDVAVRHARRAAPRMARPMPPGLLLLAQAHHRLQPGDVVLPMEPNSPVPPQRAFAGELNGQHACEFLQRMTITGLTATLVGGGLLKLVQGISSPGLDVHALAVGAELVGLGGLVMIADADADADDAAVPLQPHHLTEAPNTAHTPSHQPL